MGSITTGIGLISGIDTATLIERLLALESQGKVVLQERLADLQEQQLAMLDINARLLNLKNAAAAFRTSSVFDAASATSSDETVLTALATGAQPGTFRFIVKQLVSNSQKLSRGFADAGTTPLGLSSLSIELGRGGLSSVTNLADLNGGDGVRRGGIVITDSDGNTATIDLGAATTVNEVLEAINSSADVSVTAAVVGDHLEVTDTASGPGTLVIGNAPGDFTATDLGIAKTAVAGKITGDQVNALGSSTSLDTLNDGTGVLIRDGSPDLRITARDGVRIFDIDLGRIDAPVTDATLLADLNNGLGVTVNSDEEPDLTFVARDGTEYEVDLTGLTTVGAIRNQIDSVTGGHIQLSIHADGDKFTVTDTVGGAGNLKVLGAGPEAEETAEDLGILNVAGTPANSFDGTVLANADYTPATRTIQEVIDRINSAKDTLGADNGGHIVASIAADGVSLHIQDTVGGASNLKIESTVTNLYAARDLGIEADVAADFVDGSRLIAGINSVLIQSLNGGDGLGADNSLTITDRAGGSDTFTINLGGSVSDLIDQINASAAIQITASLNDAGNGLLLTDTVASPTGNLIITGNAADDLKIDTGAGGIAASTKRGANLQLRYVAEGTRLSQLNYGRGIGTGSFRVSDAESQFATINIGSDSTTIYDIINEINGQADANFVDVTARINDTGDGIVLENDLGHGFIRVDTTSGTTARDLRIEGQAEGDGDPIDGSYEIAIELNASDTLNEVASAINGAGIPVSAAVLNTGAGPTPYRISFTSEIGGVPGELFIDDGGADLGITTMTEGRNAKIFFGSDDPADAILIERPSNTVKDVVPGVTLDLLQASDLPVTVTVSRDVNAIIEDVDHFVATFNDAIGRIGQYDFFNADTQTRGPLLGDSTTGRIREALYRVVQGQATGIGTKFKRLSEVGITVGSGGQLVFNRATFEAAFEDDAEAVENLFAAFEQTTVTTEEVAPGVTVSTNDTTFTQLGFGELFNTLLEGLTDSLDGAVSIATDGLNGRIEQTRKRIEDFDVRLEAKRLRLERQFAAMEAALAQITSQQSALVSLTGNLTLAQSFLARR